MLSCDEGDGEPGADPVNVHDIVHGDQGDSYLMVCPQQEGEGGGEVTGKCLSETIDEMMMMLLMLKMMMMM